MASEAASARRYSDSGPSADTATLSSALVPAAVAKHSALLRMVCDLAMVAGSAILLVHGSAALGSVVVTLALGVRSLVHPRRLPVLARATLVAAVACVYAVNEHMAGLLNRGLLTEVLLIVMVSVLCALLAEHGPNPPGQTFGPGIDADAVEEGPFQGRAAFERAMAVTGVTRYTILAVGIDGLEQVERLWGSAVAAAVEARVEEGLRAWAGTRTLVTRVERDEYGVLLLNANPSTVRAAHERLVATIAVPGAELQPSISVGWAAGGGAFVDDDGAAVAWAEAREALALARELGGAELVGAGAHRVPPVDAEARLLQRVVATQALRALHEPVVDLVSGRVVAAEAVAVPACAEANMSMEEVRAAAWELGALPLVERASRHAAIDASRVLPDRLPLHVNVAVAAVADPAADAADLVALLETVGRAPSAVVLDLTDASEHQDVALVRRASDAYRAHGFGIAVDGIRSVVLGSDLLATLAPDVLKLDHATISRSVISVAAREELIQLVMRARSLGTLVIGKSIDTREAAEYAVRLGVTAAQGRHLSAVAEVATAAGVPISA